MLLRIFLFSIVITIVLQRLTFIAALPLGFKNKYLYIHFKNSFPHTFQDKCSSPDKYLLIMNCGYSDLGFMISASASSASEIGFQMNLVAFNNLTNGQFYGKEANVNNRLECSYRVARGRVYLKEQQLLTTRDKSKRTSSYCAYDDAVSHVRIVGFFETGSQLVFDFDETQAQAQELHDRRIAMRLRDSMNVGYCDAYQKIFNYISDRSRLLPCFTLIYRPF